MLPQAVLPPALHAASPLPVPYGATVGDHNGALPQHQASHVSPASLKPAENGTDCPNTEWDDDPSSSIPVEEYNSWVGETKQLSLSQKYS